MAQVIEKSVHRRETCRLCDGKNVQMAVKIPSMPIADAYVAESSLKDAQDLYPLDLYYCHECGHLQLLDVIDPVKLFCDYTYLSSFSGSLIGHFRQLAEEVAGRFQFAPGALAIDIGSNDGTLLNFFRDKGLAVLGIDPAKAAAQKAGERGVETIVEFFTPDLAGEIRNQRGAASLVTATNSFAHADDLGALAHGIRRLLSPEGVFVFEVSYALDVIEKNLWDTVYHEHLCYHGVGPLDFFLRRHGLELFDVQRVRSKSGSLRGFVQIKDGPRRRDASIDELLRLEAERGLDRIETYQLFGRRLNDAKAHLHELAGDLRSKGKKIAGFGASAGSTTMTYLLEAGGMLDFVVDDNAARHGLYSPGYHIPVLPSQVLYERKPDYVLILAWTYAEAIMKKHKNFLDQGGHFIVPLPDTTVF